MAVTTWLGFEVALIMNVEMPVNATMNEQALMKALVAQIADDLPTSDHSKFAYRLCYVETRGAASVPRDARPKDAPRPPNEKPYRITWIDGDTKTHDLYAPSRHEAALRFAAYLRENGLSQPARYTVEPQ